MMHGFLPKPDKAIGYCVSYSHHIESNALFDRSYQDKEILNAKYLFEAVKCGLEAMRDRIKDQKVSQHIYDNYKEYVSE